MLASLKTSTAFYYLGARVSPVVGEQGLTQGSPQTCCGAGEELVVSAGRRITCMPAGTCAPCLWSPARRTIDTDLYWA